MNEEILEIGTEELEEIQPAEIGLDFPIPTPETNPGAIVKESPYFRIISA